MRGEEGGDKSRDLGAMLKQPVPFRDASGRNNGGIGERISERGEGWVVDHVRMITMSKEEEREMGELGEGESVDGRLLGVEMVSNGGV